MKELYPEIIPVMLTPFHPDGTVDLNGLKQLTKFYIETGSTGLFANCLSSEMFQLSNEERIQITKAVVDKVNRRQPVYSTGTFGYDQKNNVDFIKKISDTGTDAVILNSNQLAEENETDDDWKRNTEFILESTGDIKLGIYECPVPYKRLINPELLRWLANTKRFVFLKETSCDMHIIRAKLDVVKNTPLKILNANIPTTPESIKEGAHGVASIASNFYPELVKRFVDNVNSDSSVHQKLRGMLSVIDPLIHEAYPKSAKYFLKKRGIKIDTFTRKNVDFTYQDYLKFDKLHEVFVNLSEELEIELFKI